MLGDPHSRSAHRASPAGGLALLSPQALVRQAQAGQARARQAIIRQALAHQTRGHRATVRSTPVRGRPATDDQLAPLHALGLQTVVRLAAEYQAAERQGMHGPVAATPHRGIPVRQRHALQRRALREPQQTLQSLLRGLAALIVLAIVGLSAFFIIAEQRRGDGRDSVAAPSAEPGIASREVDAEPLTQREVFPEPAVQLAAGAEGYQVTLTHSDSECRIATTGELGALLHEHGCDQVVRARLTAPYGGYQVTTGIFNLADENGAARVSEIAGTLVETGRGTFGTLGGATDDPLTEPLAQVSWHSRGHYLLYCVIARPDGQLVTDDDPYAGRITAELVGQYLGEQVVGGRTLDP